LSLLRILGEKLVMYSKRLIALFTACILSILVISGIPEVYAVETPSSDLNAGPYVDHIVYKVIANQDQRILALQAGDIEMDNGFFDPVYFDQLASDPDINIYQGIRNGYGHITINCRDYPLNISALRRAFAYAFDKTEVTVEIMDGFSQEHDSVVPYPNGWCVEDDFSYHYYTDQTAIGAQILADAGFTIDGGTGFLLAPNGDSFDITIEYAASSPEIAGGTAQIGVDALRRLGVNANTQAADFNEYITCLDSHGNYDMVFYAQNFYSNDVDWLAYEYWSGYANIPYQNPSNFVNATYDSWRDQLLYATTYEDVYDAAAEMQRILQYNVPKLIVYENTNLQGYRNDQFTGHVEDLGRYISGSWTMRKIHNLDGTLGGSVPVAIGQEPDSFNIFVTNSAYSAAILSNLYSSLYKYGPDLNPWPDLAESMLVETHDDNAAVPAGHTRFTIDIIQNATWSDGMSITAEDVAFTFTYHVESGSLGNPAGADLGDLVASYAPTPYRVVLEFSIESYWLFSNFGFDYIIPEHIFNDASGIGYAGWNTWNPVFDPAEPHITSGPFIFTDYDAGDWYEITNNPLFYYPATDLVEPNPAPVITAADDINYVVGTTGNEIVWEASDDDPLTYVVIKDLETTPVASGIWDGSDITVNVDGLLIGTYNYTLALMDYSANLVMDSVIVTVVNVTTTTTTTTSSTTTSTGVDGGLFEGNTLTILISIGSLGVIVVTVVLIWKSKQS